MRNETQKWCLILGVVILFTAQLRGQAAPSGTPAGKGTSSTAIQIPLSGKPSQYGSVTPLQSTPNGGGANGADLLNSSVNIQGQYSGSIPVGENTDRILSLRLDYALELACATI